MSFLAWQLSQWRRRWRKKEDDHKCIYHAGWNYYNEVMDRLVHLCSHMCKLLRIWITITNLHTNHELRFKNQSINQSYLPSLSSLRLIAESRLHFKNPFSFKSKLLSSSSIEEGHLQQIIIFISKILSHPKLTAIILIDCRRPPPLQAVLLTVWQRPALMWVLREIINIFIQ